MQHVNINLNLVDLYKSKQEQNFLFMNMVSGIEDTCIDYSWDLVHLQHTGILMEENFYDFLECAGISYKIQNQDELVLTQDKSVFICYIRFVLDEDEDGTKSYLKHADFSTIHPR